MSDPVQVADGLWKRLIAHQPAVAAALALQLRDLPNDWPQRLLGITRPHAALELPAPSGMPMEIQPYGTSDWESCLACAESVSSAATTRASQPATRRWTGH
ncbi:hypothetical protein QC334_34110 [Streptomyces sp. DH18]|uniref:hypothetical protein n=1 Tax=Streptomyces sp. DH18 TaxID=3040126 RepID=UPI00244252AB|nr:hypothetical protein [Streptomyces sp. DH18]MDG9687706.1 hypothetical protein [Streptomyces sp. DH18]